MSSGRFTAVEVDQTIEVDRPAGQLFRIATDPSALARYGAGIATVQLRGGRRSTWRTRSILFPRALEMAVTVWLPGRHVAMQSDDGCLTADVEFVPLGVGRASVTVHATYRAPGPARELLAQIGVLAGCVQRTLVRLKHHAEGRPLDPEPVPDRRDPRAVTADPRAVPDDVGYPRAFGYSRPGRHAASAGTARPTDAP